MIAMQSLCGFCPEVHHSQLAKVSCQQLSVRLMYAGFEHTAQPNLCMAQLRNRVSQSCLLGCVGEINAGKTSLVRALLGLPQQPNGHKPENATQCAAVFPMPVPGSEGLQVIQASPLLVDTPGMFDEDSTLADCAVRYLGNCH